MIPAVRYFSGRTLSSTRAEVFSLRFSFTVPLLLIAVIISALSMIYATNEARNLNAELHRAERDRSRLHVEWQQLLLEKSTLTHQSRVRHFAEHRLDMVIPTAESVVDLHG